jgi:DNA-directed RNA polymerase specialized sigma24 family protein
MYLEGKSYREIAEITGLDWNQVKSHIQNGKRNLRQKLGMLGMIVILILFISYT